MDDGPAGGTRGGPGARGSRVVGVRGLLTALRVSGLATAVAALLLAVVWLLQDRLVYLPSGAPPDPEAVGLPEAAQVDLVTDDGLTLGAWFVPARGVDGVDAHAVLVLPGNAGNRSSRAPLATALSEAGLAVLLLDYRGYGGNPGAPSEDGLLADARAGHAYLARRVGPGRVSVYGESLGAGVAVALAAEHPPRALVLRSPFTSLAAVGAVHYPFLPVRLLLRERFDVLGGVGAYDGPVLVVAGEADTIVPVEQSRRVADAADARVVTVPGADHNDRVLLDGPALVQAVTSFLREPGRSS